MSQLDGSDIVYVARVAVPKLIALRVEIGTRFPAARPPRARCCWRRSTRRSWRRCWPSPAAPACRRFLPRDPSAFRRELRDRPGPRLGAGRRGARTRHPIGRRTGPRRRRRGPRGDERHRARRRDQLSSDWSTSTCRCCCARPATCRPTGRSWQSRPYVRGRAVDERSRRCRVRTRNAEHRRQSSVSGVGGSPMTDLLRSAAPSQRVRSAGIVVADFSRVLAGPYATMLLADLGADVIKVESPTGDDTRTGCHRSRDDVGTYYLSINRNKRSIVLDLTHPDGPRGRPRPVRPGRRASSTTSSRAACDRFGLDYDAVAARNPRSIYCSISGFGTGRRRRAARLRPAGAGHVRPDEPDRRPATDRRTAPASRSSTS